MGAVYQAEDLYVTGRAFAEAAKVVALAVHRPGNGLAEPMKLPAWHLLATATELLLKAAFRTLGGPSSELSGKNGINHDLQIAFDRAVALRFQPPSRYTAVLVARLRQHHLEHVMRYLPEHREDLETARLGDAYAALERLADAVHDLVYPNHDLAEHC